MTCCVLRSPILTRPGCGDWRPRWSWSTRVRESPRESYLRLLLIDAGLPRPQTQIPVLGVDGMPVAYLDLGWEECMVAVEYDGDQHRIDRRQYVKDIRRLEMLERMGWIIVRVVAEDGPAKIVRRVRDALAASSVRLRALSVRSGRGSAATFPPWTSHSTRRQAA